jgi:hypothetical protein
MPPAFLFPESDPPPSDLVPVPENSSTPQSSSSNTLLTSQEKSLNHAQLSVPNQGQKSSKNHYNSENMDSTDASPTMRHHNHLQFMAEEYTIPDLFPHPTQQIQNKDETSFNDNPDFVMVRIHIYKL